MSLKTNEYKKAMDEMKASNDLKRRTLQKIEDRGKFKNYIVVKRVLSMAAVFMLVFSLTFTINRNRITNNDNQEQVTNSAKLPTVDTYEKMKELLEKGVKSTRSYGMNYMVEDAEIATSLNTTSKATNSDYSTTNVQVQGVDEADIVKTNGKYIFYCKDGKISVIDVDSQKLINNIEFKNDSPIEMYLNNDKLIVITNKNANKRRAYYYYSNDELKIVQYDISDIKNIKSEREVEVEGSLLTSRMIDNNIYVISNKFIYEDLLDDEEKLKPVYKDSANGDSEKCIEFNEIQYCPGVISNSYMMVTSFDTTNKNKVANIQTYLGSGEDVYASTENLYVTYRNYEEDRSFFGIEYTVYNNSTKIYKFSLNNGQTEYVAEATVPGYIDNQFSMDEYNGYFRIATTYYAKETLYKDINNLYVLDKDMNLVGQIENLAPDESIYAVRYMGDTAYVVTYEQIDPLFVIDLSNPTEPKVLGELKIPGYSEYLHPYDETHIIGFGRDTETDGEFVKNKGFKMALFDVSDLSNPKELYSVSIGDNGTYSELLYNHKALLFSKEKDLIAFPIVIREKQNGSQYYSSQTFNGALIYGLSIDKGFEEKAKIESESQVDRIIYIGDKIYTISKDEITITDMNTMEEIGEIEL